MSINPAFLEYFRQEFFSDDATGFEAFQKSLLRPLKKTLRINTNKIDMEAFMREKETVGWKFGATPNGHVFHVDREDTTIALGSNPEHLRGDYYIQELSASMSVWHLSDGQIHPEPYRILEMASSPGGKTTQIAEHYPNSFIVANEFNKERIVPLLENIERMGLANTAVTNMNGIQFRDLPNAFDLVLLDAPCSGEGIGFKAAESLRYWNIKNVKTIARLQKKMLIAGLTALKPGGTLVYSTCTLNRFENEEVLEEAKKEFGEDIEIAFSKRFWPHTEIAGGFFVAKITKKLSAADSDREPNAFSPNADISELTDRNLSTVEKYLGEIGTVLPDDAKLYRYKNDILLVRASTDISDLIDSIYAIRFGMRIGRIEGHAFEPQGPLGVHFEHRNLPRYELSKPELPDLLR